PEEWKGSLRIPVEFIKVRPSRCLDEKVYADIQIGHHLMLWLVLICEKGEIKLYGNRILDPRLIAIIEQILSKEDLREEISYACNNGRTYINTGAEFIESIAGYDTEKTLPAIRFY
ncbi:hypothetical protein KA005_40750, partial [bacterium]|nr:hypothetical protein [bacterium]